LSDVDYATREEAEGVAQERGLQLIAVHYVWHDSELVEDYTRWHWVVSTRVVGDTVGYLPEGPDVCSRESVEDARTELVRRFENAFAESNWCEKYRDSTSRCRECDPCRAYRDVGDADDALNRADVEQDQGFTVTLRGDGETGLVYTIARVLLRGCPIHGHER